MYIMKRKDELTCERRSESTNGEPCDIGIPSENKNKGCGGCYCDVCLPLALLYWASMDTYLVKEP